MTGSGAENRSREAYGSPLQGVNRSPGLPASFATADRDGPFCQASPDAGESVRSLAPLVTSSKNDGGRSDVSDDSSDRSAFSRPAGRDGAAPVEPSSASRCTSERARRRRSSAEDSAEDSFDDGSSDAEAGVGEAVCRRRADIAAFRHTDRR